MTSLVITKTKEKTQESPYVCYNGKHDWAIVETHDPNRNHRHECTRCAEGYDCDGG